MHLSLTIDTTNLPPFEEDDVVMVSPDTPSLPALKTFPLFAPPVPASIPSPDSDSPIKPFKIELDPVVPKPRRLEGIELDPTPHKLRRFSRVRHSPMIIPTSSESEFKHLSSILAGVRPGIVKVVKSYRHEDRQ